ncbi:MAG: DNA polymerase III subunit beta [Candidatus Pacebacteria bacterium]|nr:DNA polymerase III subunit beta [Candidatus Paceibacterota bacterium]
MKVECEIDKIKNGILLAEKITGKNLTLPVLSSILLEATNKSLKLKAMNLSLGIEIEIPAKISEEGILAISGNSLASVFSNIIQKENIILEGEEGNLLIKTKKNKIKLKGMPYEDFPTIPVVAGDSFEIESKKIIEGIKSVYYSASVSDIKPEISSVYVYSKESDLVFVSTDSFRLAEKKIKLKKSIENFNVLIPFKNIAEIMRVIGENNQNINICFNKNQISFSLDNIYLTSRIIDGIYPDYRQIIPKESKTEVVLLKQDLLNALKISNIFSDKFNQLNLSINTKDKIFEFSSSNNDVGENKTYLDAVLKGEDINLSFNYKYFLDAFASLSTDSVSIKLDGPQKPMVINSVSDNSFTYLIMPMNR